MKTPLLIWSPPGCGKTAAVEVAARSLGLAYWVQVQSQEDPVDTCGVIVPDHAGRTSDRYVPAYWSRACTAPHLLFYDEVTTCDSSQFAAMLRATDDSRSMHGCTLHPGTIIIAAANPPEMAAGAARELPPPVLSRFRHWRIDASYALAWMRGEPGLDARIVKALSYQADATRSAVMVRVVGAYLDRNLAAALATAEETRAAVERQDPLATPRGWTRAASEAPDSPEIWGEWVGDKWAAGFLAWFASQDLPDPQAIADGKETRVPDRGDAVMATAGSLAAVLGVKPAEARLKHVMTWFAAAAVAGHAADCATGIRVMAREVAAGGIGAIRFSRYAKEMGPYAAMLRAAGAM